MQVWLIEEYEPNSDFPYVIKEVCASLERANELIAEYERTRDEDGEQTADDIWWEMTAWEVV